MAVLTIPAESRTLHDEQSIRAELCPYGLEYERWDLSRVSPDAAPDQVLAAYSPEIEEMKRTGGYTTADVIDVHPHTPGLDEMLARFDKEHTHSEDEVRFILAGRGIFFLHLQPKAAQPCEEKTASAERLTEKVLSIELGPGDMLRVPRGTAHWFTLCEDRRIRAIRWFQDSTGWTPAYTQSGIDTAYQPLCFGPAYQGEHSDNAVELQP